MNSRDPLFPTRAYDVARWHLVGVFGGAIVATAMIQYRVSSPGHPVGWSDALRGLAAVFGAAIAFSPLLIALLVFVRWLEQQYSSIAQNTLVRCVALIGLAAIAAATIHLTTSATIAAVLAVRDGVTFRSIWNGPFHFPEFYFIVFSGTCTWAVLPAVLHHFSAARVDAPSKRADAALQ